MNDMLSQDEINALLNGIDEEEKSIEENGKNEYLDKFAEIVSVSLSTASTTLYSMLGKKASIEVKDTIMTNWDSLVSKLSNPSVAIQSRYEGAVLGDYVIFLDEYDSKKITDLVMGEESPEEEVEIGELHLSAVKEVFNQVIESKAASISKEIREKVMSTESNTMLVDTSEKTKCEDIADFLCDEFVEVSFQLKVGELLDSVAVVAYQQSLVDELLDKYSKDSSPKPVEEETVSEVSQAYEEKSVDTSMNNSFQTGNVEVQRAEFKTFDATSYAKGQGNIDLIMDVPLNVSVELGRTNRSIKEILEFSPGTIIELDKIAGEPIDVLVNGKVVARGEVVVIAENFSIRLTEIIKNNNIL